MCNSITPSQKGETQEMINKLTFKNIFLLSLLLLSAALLFAALPQTSAAGPIPIIIIDADGVSHTINDITTMTSTAGAGGYKSNSQIQAGDFQGVSLYDLCTAIGTTLANYQNVTVGTTGGSGTNTTFNYEQVASGTNIYPQYNSYNDSTGAVQAPTQPVTLIVAYQQTNGTALPGSGTITRLLIVGPEGLLFQGPGLAGVVNITITNVGTVPTPTPSPTPTASPTPKPSPSPTPTISPSPSPSPSPTASPTSTSSPSPTPARTSSEGWPVTYSVIIAIIIIIIIIAAAVLVLRRRKTP
jgi:hypothetical protein